MRRPLLALLAAGAGTAALPAAWAWLHWPVYRDTDPDPPYPGRHRR